MFLCFCDMDIHGECKWNMMETVMDTGPVFGGSGFSERVLTARGENQEAMKEVVEKSADL